MSLFDQYLDYTRETEPPMIFHRWSLISCIGALLGRQYYFPFGEFRIFPNQYVMLIGDPGTRKSTAIKLAKKVTAASGYDKFSADRTSKEKFLLDLEGLTDDEGKVKDANAVMTNLFGDDAHADPKEVFVVADEFNEFVGAGNLEFLSLLGNLWDWDDPDAPFKQRLKTSRSVSIFQPTLSILSGNTHAGFASAFPPEAIGQGFMSRLVLIYGEASGKKIAFPKRPEDAARQDIVRKLVEIRSRVMGEATLSAKAREMLEVIYRNYQAPADVRFKHYGTRRFTHLIKMCLVVSAANLRTEIGAHDVMLANTILSYAEHFMPRAMGEYGKARNSDVSAKIVAMLTDSIQPLQIQDIWRQVRADLEKMDDLNKLLAGLLSADRIQWVQGRGYMIVRKALRQDTLYVNYSLLREHSERGITL